MKHFILLPFAISMGAVTSVIAATPPDAHVETYAIHENGNIVYHYAVTNESSRPISMFSVGLRFIIENAQTTDQDEYDMELTQPLLGYDRTDALIAEEKREPTVDQGLYSSPNGWHGNHLYMEESGYHTFEWLINRNPVGPAIEYRQTFRFSATTTKRDQAYLTGHFTVAFGDVKEPGEFSDTMHLIDTQAPALSLSVDPSVIWPPNNKLAPVSVKVTVSDDYDPAPEIQLVSIVANETLTASDVKNADLGKDDRSFDLMATRAGGNKDGRIYTITYAAIDASGNKSTASVNVTVPHDQSKK